MRADELAIVRPAPAFVAFALAHRTDGTVTLGVNIQHDVHRSIGAHQTRPDGIVCKRIAGANS
jgi:hypothetical protein